MDDLTALRLIDEIKALKASYFRLLDTKQWDAWEQLFTKDIRFECPDDQPGMVNEGRPAFVAASRALIERAKTIHHGHMPEIELLSETSARGIWAMEDLIWWPDEDVARGLPRRMHGFGHYHETYERSEQGWRIDTMTITRLRREDS